MAAHIWFQLTTQFIDPERMKGWVKLSTNKILQFLTRGAGWCKLTSCTVAVKRWLCCCYESSSLVWFLDNHLDTVPVCCMILAAHVLLSPGQYRLVLFVLYGQNALPVTQSTVTCNAVRTQSWQTTSSATAEGLRKHSVRGNVVDYC